jgi:hypothetical protein
MSDDWMHAAFGARALSGFHLQLEPEWVDGCRSGGELAFRFAWQDTAGEEPPIRCLGRIIASGDA